VSHCNKLAVICKTEFNNSQTYSVSSSSVDDVNDEMCYKHNDTESKSEILYHTTNIIISLCFIYICKCLHIFAFGDSCDIMN